MSGFAYPSPIFNSDVYNPSFYLSLDPSGFLSYEYAQTLYLGKNDYRLTYITGITPSVATAGVAIVLDNDLSLTGLGAVSCDSLTVGGNSIINPPDYVLGITIGSAAPNKALVLNGSSNITGIGSLTCLTLNSTNLFLTGSGNMITLTNTNAGARSTIYFSGNGGSSSWEFGSRNSAAGPYEGSMYWFNQSAFRMVLRNNGSLWVQNLIECSSLTASGQITCSIADCTTYKQAGTTLDFSNLGLINGITAGTAQANKALILDASSNITGINSLSCTALSVNGVSITGIVSPNITGSSLVLTGSNDMITLSNAAPVSRMSIQYDGDSVTSSWESGVQCSNNGSESNNFYWYNQSAYKMVLRSSGQLYVQSGVLCNGVASSGQIDCPILNCTNYALITNTLDLGGQLTLTAGDVSVRSGDVVVDDGKSLILARDVLTKDINSRIYSSGLSQMTIASTRGGGNILFDANRSGGASTLFSFIFCDGFSGPGIRNGIMALYPTEQVRIGGINESHTPYFNPYFQLDVRDGIMAATHYSDQQSISSAGYKPKFVWQAQASGQGSNNSNLCAIGVQDGVGNRSRIGIGYALSAPDSNNVVFHWDTSGTGCSMYAGSWNTTSDIRLKKDITASPYGLDTIMQLNPCRYQFKHQPEEGFNLGLIAQEVMHIVPECVPICEEGVCDREDSPIMMSVDYNQLVPVLIKAVQELSATVETLTNRLDRIEARPVLKKWLEKNSS